jgi:hypothetical protein
MTSVGAVELEELDDVDLISIQKVDALGLMSADFDSGSSPIREETFMQQGNCCKQCTNSLLCIYVYAGLI